MIKHYINFLGAVLNNILIFHISFNMLELNTKSHAANYTIYGSTVSLQYGTKCSNTSIETNCKFVDESWIYSEILFLGEDHEECPTYFEYEFKSACYR